MKRILWIDDDEAMLDSCVPLFERNGFLVLKATNTSRALTILRTDVHRLAGVLLDVRLSEGEDGLELLEELRHRHPDLKVVVFTAYPDYRDHVSAQALGALSYFAKIDKSIPLDPPKQREFFTALDRLFPNGTTLRRLEEKRRPSNEHRQPIWGPAIVMILIFFSVLGGITAVSRFVPGWLFPVAIAFAVLFFVLLTVSLLRVLGSEALSEEGFSNVVAKVLEQTVQLVKLWRGKEKERERPDTVKEEPTDN